MRGLGAGKVVAFDSSMVREKHGFKLNKEVSVISGLGRMYKLHILIGNWYPVKKSGHIMVWYSEWCAFSVQCIVILHAISCEGLSVSYLLLLL